MIYDISNYQKGLDLKELEDLEGVIIRIGWGDDLSDQDDPEAPNFIEQCRELGVPYGLYLFSYATDEGKSPDKFIEHRDSEIEHMARWVTDYQPQLGAWLDIENDEPYKQMKCRWWDDQHADEYNEYIRMWLERFEGGIYCDRWHMSFLDVPSDKLWIATLDGTKIEDCVLCQFTSDPLDTNAWGNYRLEAHEDAAEAEEEDTEDVTYIVEPGDTLWSIAERFFGDGNRYKEIAELNNLADPNIIHAGQELVIQRVSDGDEEESLPADYIVQEGDTLWSIAERAYGDGSKYTELAEKNGLGNPELIYPGQRIML